MSHGQHRGETIKRPRRFFRDRVAELLTEPEPCQPSPASALAVWDCGDVVVAVDSSLQVVMSVPDQPVVVIDQIDRLRETLSAATRYRDQVVSETAGQIMQLGNRFAPQ